MPVIQWNISQETASQYQQLDRIAQARYTNLYSQFYNGKKVDIDCLGMGKYFFCASAYPVCIDTGTEQRDSKYMK